MKIALDMVCLDKAVPPPPGKSSMGVSRSTLRSTPNIRIWLDTDSNIIWIDYDGAHVCVHVSKTTYFVPTATPDVIPEIQPKVARPRV